MNERWNLDPIYKGFDDPAFERDLETLKQKVAEFGAFAEELKDLAPIDGLRKGVELSEELYALVENLAGYGFLRQAADTKNPECGSQIGRVMSYLKRQQDNIQKKAKYHKRLYR